MVETVASRFLETLGSAEARVFTKRYMLIAAAVLLVAQAPTLGALFTWHWPYIPTAFSTGCVDFGWTWLSGRFAALHESARVFDYPSFAKAQADLFGAGKCTVLWSFPYPPTMLFFTYPFGLLPFVTAYVLWTVVLIVFFVGAVYAIARRALVAAGALAMNSAVINIYLGQNAFLTAGLQGFALAMLERRPVAAGALLALLTYKPQYGILIPIALIASRNWRALASATGFSVALVAASALAFGREGWPQFLFQLMNRDQYLSQNRGFPAQHYSVYGVLQSSGFNLTAAWATQAAVVLLLAVIVWRAWSKPAPLPLRASLLCVASILATPYVLYYDLSLLAIALAFLVGEGLQRGFLAGEMTVMALCWLKLVVGHVSQSVGLIICGFLMLLLYRRLARHMYVAAQQSQPAFTVADLS